MSSGIQETLSWSGKELQCCNVRKEAQRPQNNNLSAPEPVTQDFRNAEHLASGRFRDTGPYALG